MRVEQNKKKTFVPVEITLESSEELCALRLVLNHALTRKDEAEPYGKEKLQNMLDMLYQCES